MSAKDERRGAALARKPRVTCESCGFGWYSARLAEGLRLLAACPRCGGILDFSAAPADAVVDLGPPRFSAPHLALGFPRPRPR